MINENGLLNIFPTAEASGSIVSFENGADGIPMESLSVAVEPTQDLHGYDHPWPAGGGVNKLAPASISKINEPGLTVTLTATELNGYTATKVDVSGTMESWGWRILQQGVRSVLQPSTAYRITFLTNSSSTFVGTISTAATTHRLSNNLSFTSTQISNGIYQNSAEFTTYSSDNSGWDYNDQVILLFISPNTSPLSFTIVNDICLTLQSSATGWYPYSNICPITGRTGLSVYRTGVNIWDEEWELGAISGSNGADSPSTTSIRGKNYISVIPNKTYYYKGFSTNPFLYDMNKAYIGRLGSYLSANSFTIPDGCYFMRVAWGAGYGTTYNNDISINYPSTDHDYHAYNGTTYAIDWTAQAGTVYGGTVDVVTGVLTVDRAMVDLGTLRWSYFSSGQTGFISNGIASTAKKPPSNSVKANILCSDYACYSADGVYQGNVGVALNVSPQVWYHDGVHTDSDLVGGKAQWLDGVYLVYELATPLTYQLTPQEVATLLGANRVWSDAGDISLVYHTQVDATPSSIDGLFINGEGLQADGWFLKWRKLAAPKPKTDYVSVWGRDGDIDLTESETDGQVFYENRELTMDMVYMGEDWTDAYSELLDMLHGKECAVQFSNDPYWYWAGRIIASLYEHKPHSLAMSGIMFPYKLSVAKVTKSATVSGAIESNGVEVVLPSSRMRVSPKVTVVAGTGESVTLKWGTKTQTLSAGTYYVRGLKVGSDDVTIKVWGTGTVTFEYRKGML